MGKASDNIFPKVQMSTAIASTAPSGGTWRMEARADGIYAVSSNTGSAGTGPFSAGASGAVATDAIWDVAGDLVQGTGANTAARLALGAVGTVVRSTGATNAYALPPGHEYDYVQKTTDTSITATTEATADTIVTGAAVTYDGATPVVLEFTSPLVTPDSTAAGRNILVVLYDGASFLARLGSWTTPAAAGMHIPSKLGWRFTPSAASHTYSIRAYVNGGTGTVVGGTGSGANAYVPCAMRITKV